MERIDECLCFLELCDACIVSCMQRGRNGAVDGRKSC